MHHEKSNQKRQTKDNRLTYEGHGGRQVTACDGARLHHTLDADDVQTQARHVGNVIAPLSRPRR